MNETCGNCKFYKSGDCRRYPPENQTSYQHPYNIAQVWPFVLERNWCGEWQKDCSPRSENNYNDT